LTSACCLNGGHSRDDNPRRYVLTSAGTTQHDQLTAELAERREVSASAGLRSGESNDRPSMDEASEPLWVQAV
jgi:hypothetical protein